MANIRLRQYVPFLGSNTVIGMAQKVGLTRPPPVSVRNLINLAEKIILPYAPLGLQPQNGSQGISNNPFLFFFDPAKGTPAAIEQFEFKITSHGKLVDNPNDPLPLGVLFINPPFNPPGVKWVVTLPQGEVTLTVFGTNKAGKGPASSSTFTVGTSAPPPPQPPTPQPPPNLPSISKLSLFNCQIERHTVFVWVRELTVIGNTVTNIGPWGQIQKIPSQFNASGQCPFDDNGILANSEAILTKNGEGGGFVCTNGKVYQVSIVDPERPTCDGRNDPTIGNCVVEDQPSFFKFQLDGDEVTVMLEDGRLSPVPS